MARPIRSECVGIVKTRKNFTSGVGVQLERMGKAARRTLDEAHTFERTRAMDVLV